MTRIFSTQYPIIIVAGLILCFSLNIEGANDLFRFDRHHILSGQVYRLLTAHFVHLSCAHSLVNILAAVVGWLLFKDVMENRQWLLSMLGSGIIISFLLWCNQSIQWYVGFSAIVHSLVLQGLMLERRLNFLVRGSAVGLLILKVSFELLQGPNQASLYMVGGDILVEAHLYGLVAGSIMLLVIKPDRLKFAVREMCKPLKRKKRVR